MKMKLSSRIYSGIVFCFLFAPIVVLLVFSFNDSKSLAVFSGFSLRWYEELLRDRNTLESVKNTLILAASATAIATVIGTMAAVGINKLRSKWYRAVMNTVTDIPMTNPDIITGIFIGITLEPDAIHIMKKSEYSGMFGDYSSFSNELDELSNPESEEEE